MNLIEAADGQFEGADIDALRTYCDEMGVEYSKSHNSATLRKKLLDYVGEYQEHSGAPESDIPIRRADSEHLKVLGLGNLQLRSQGAWDGRRRIVMLQRAMDNESLYPQFFAWGALHCYIPFGITAAIPYPIYNALRATAGERITRKRRVDEEGRIYFEEVRSPTQRFMFTDMGDDPETAHLPTDLRDMIRMLYQSTSGFKGFEQRQFRELCRRLRISVKPTWNAVDMRDVVIRTCQIGIVKPSIAQEPLAQPKVSNG